MNAPSCGAAFDKAESGVQCFYSVVLRYEPEVHSRSQAPGLEPSTAINPTEAFTGRLLGSRFQS